MRRTSSSSLGNYDGSRFQFGATAQFHCAKLIETCQFIDDWVVTLVPSTVKQASPARDELSDLLKPRFSDTVIHELSRGGDSPVSEQIDLKAHQLKETAGEISSRIWWPDMCRLDPSFRSFDRSIVTYGTIPLDQLYHWSPVAQLKAERSQETMDRGRTHSNIRCVGLSSFMISVDLPIAEWDAPLYLLLFTNLAQLARVWAPYSHFKVLGPRRDLDSWKLAKLPSLGGQEACTLISYFASLFWLTKKYKNGCPWLSMTSHYVQ